MTIPCFVISLAGSPRREVIAKALEGAGITFSFFDAVDGRAMSAERRSEVYDGIGRKNRHLSPGEIGCALSHLTLYRRMVAENIPEALILEDDAIIDRRLAEFLARRSSVPSEADVVSLHSVFGHVRKWPKFHVGPIGCHRASSAPWYTVGYIIRRRGAEIFSAHNPKVSRTADWPCGFHLLRFYVTIPVVVEHDIHAQSVLGTGRTMAGQESKPTSARDTRYTLQEQAIRKVRKIYRRIAPGRHIDLGRMYGRVSPTGSPT